jgi:hypothetical protein
MGIAAWQAGRAKVYSISIHPVVKLLEILFPSRDIFNFFFFSAAVTAADPPAYSAAARILVFGIDWW